MENPHVLQTDRADYQAFWVGLIPYLLVEGGNIFLSGRLPSHMFGMKSHLDWAVLEAVTAIDALDRVNGCEHSSAAKRATQALTAHWEDLKTRHCPGEQPSNARESNSEFGLCDLIDFTGV